MLGSSRGNGVLLAGWRLTVHLRIQITGESGKGKTRTALTSRGRLAMLDHEASGWLYLARTPDGFEPAWALMEGDFPLAGLCKGDRALWMAPDPTVATKDNVLGFVKAAGLGVGDTFIHDGGSLVWDWAVEATDIQFGQKGMKIDWQAMKRPTNKVNWAYRKMACDVIQTARGKAEWDKDKNAPTGNIVAGGERASTPYLFHFEFRMAVEGGIHTLICTKQRGGFFKTGERIAWPNLSGIFAERGIYALLDSVKEPEVPDSEETLGQKAESFLGLKVSEVSEGELAKLSEECREACKAGRLEDFRKDKGIKARAAGLSPAHLAEFKQVIKDLSELVKG